MSDTTKQQMNAYRVRRALRDYQCYMFRENAWHPIGPLIYFANRTCRGCGCTEGSDQN